MKVTKPDDFRTLHRPFTVEEKERMKSLMQRSPTTIPPCIIWKCGKLWILVDGYHRHDLCVALGITPKYVKMDFPDRQQALAFAASIQMGRRNSGKEEFAKLIKDYPLKTLEAIAEANGNATPPVSVAAKNHPSGGGSKRKRIAAVAAAANCSDTTARKAIESDEEPEEPEPLTDDEGQSVPGKLAEIFGKSAEFEDHARTLTKIQKWAEETIGKDYGTWFHVQSFVADLNNAKQALRFNKPYAVCPYCQAKKKSCDACKGHGFVSKGIYKGAPAEMRV